MATSIAEALADAHLQRYGSEVELLCECGEAWVVTAVDGLRDDQRVCPDEDCPGIGVAQ